MFYIFLSKNYLSYQAYNISNYNRILILETLNQELNSVKFELSAKTIQEENLVKETLAQTQSIISLKQMCSQQELQINQLKSEYNSIKSERLSEIETHQKEV